MTDKTATADITNSEGALGPVRAYLDAHPEITTLRIEVHSDSVGSAKAQQDLTNRRALAVGALVAAGVDCKRLVAVGFGAQKPIADNSTAEGRAKNRRTTFVNAALRGHAIGGAPLDGGGQVAGDACGARREAQAPVGGKLDMFAPLL